jgi:hypothetical protein
MDKEPFVNSGIVTYAWVIGISLWGGIVSYFDKKEPFNMVRLIAHLSSSSFAGLMTFFLCQYGNMPGPLTGVLCGVAAHMGTPALIKLAMRLKYVRQFFAESPDEEKKP